MSICTSAALVYGVILDESEKAALEEREDRDEIFDSFAFDCNLISGGDVIIGITIDSIECGEAIELGSIIEPRTNDMDQLLEVLDTLGIDREPTWLLAGTIS